jgi:hypothetical protein
MARLEQLMVKPSRAKGRSAASYARIKERARKWNRDARTVQIEKGLCTRAKCPNKPAVGGRYCENHLAASRIACRNYHRERRVARG